MSKLYNKYLELKSKDNSSFYLFRSGMFYIFLDEDAKAVSKKLNLKLTNFNDTVLKCGFPLNSISKYASLLDDNKIAYKIIDGSLIDSKVQYIQNQNIQNYLAQIKKMNINKITPLKALEIISDLQKLLRRSPMKRKGNLYKNIYNFNNIISAFNEVCKNTKSKRRVENLKQYKAIYISRIYNILKNKKYSPGPVHIFTIYEPKRRRIISQNSQDKIINHLIARQILYPAILPCLLDINVASRKGYGTRKGIEYATKFNQICKIKYRQYYILKCDISKFFASVNHDILKAKLKKKIKDKDALKIVFDIIDSEKDGLGIGAMTSQVLAIFYLNDMDHFIKEELKIKYYVRYQDDFLLFHPSKKYLSYCLDEINKFLEKEKLTLNKKTRIYKNTNNFIFLGRNMNGKYSKYRDVNRKIKKRIYLYKTNKISLSSLTNSIICYNGLCGNKINVNIKKDDNL